MDDNIMDDESNAEAENQKTPRPKKAAKRDLRAEVDAYRQVRADSIPVDEMDGPGSRAQSFVFLYDS